MLKKIISGGQTGADFAGLRAGRKLRLETGGTAPKGWRVQHQDGSEETNQELAEYGLKEHESREYPSRTRQNVRDSDGTVWFGYAKSPGAKITLGTATVEGKPVLVNPTATELKDWVAEHNIKVLNVAGNRLTNFNEGMIQRAYDTLVEAFSPAIDKK